MVYRGRPVVSGALMAFVGRNSGPAIALSNQTVQDLGANNPASSGYRLSNGGDVVTLINGGASTVGAWISPATGFADYEVEAVVASGSGGTLTGTTGSGTWQNLGTTRTWTLSSSTSGLFCDRVLTISIRDVATATVRATASITLQVEAL